MHRHLTASMCDAVFRDLRTSERARTWTLGAMAQFWVAVVMRAPKSLREALEEAHGGRLGVPVIDSSPSSFFERSQDLRWEFFHEVFDRFLARLLPECPPVFERDLRKRLTGFPDVWVVDGSGLDKIARKLKVLCGVRESVLPGSVLAFYDLYRGVPRALLFDEKRLGGEAKRLRDAAHLVPAGTLLVMDRGFTSTRLLAELPARGVHAVMRIKSNILLSGVQELGRYEIDGAQVVDRIATLGGKGSPKARVRIIEKTSPDGTVLRLAVTVLDPAQFPAAAVLVLYRRRWAIERMFQDLKEVLNLRRFYAANTNAVAMQVYASAIVYAAMRATQAKIAETHERRPEELSTAKLFPRIAAAHFRLVSTIEVFEVTRRANAHVDLVEPDWSRVRIYDVRLSRMLVVKRRRSGAESVRPSPCKRTVSLQNYQQRPPPRGPPA